MAVPFLAMAIDPDSLLRNARSFPPIAAPSSPQTSWPVSIVRSTTIPTRSVRRGRPSSSGAKEELDVAAVWFEEQRRGLGSEFLTAIEEVLGVVAE